MKFEELRLAEPIVRAVAAVGYTTPTPIQTKAIPAALVGKDVFGGAQTGTGKTAAFALPLSSTGSRRQRPGGRNGSRRGRPRALDGFKSGMIPVLVATDVALRGIDVDDITHVVNFNIPNVPETYVHRVGRTARADASGIAISFCDHEELDDLRAIERLIGMHLEVVVNEPDLVFDAPMTHRKRSGHQFPLSPAAGTPRGKRGRPRAGRSGQSAATGPSGRP